MVHVEAVMKLWSAKVLYANAMKQSVDDAMNQDASPSYWLTETSVRS